MAATEKLGFCTGLAKEYRDHESFKHSMLRTIGGELVLYKNGKERLQLLSAPR